MSSKQKIAFIINPISGTGKQKHAESIINKYIDTNLFDFKVIYTTATEHSDVIVEREINNYDHFVAVGGDGTVNQTAVKLINTNKSLGILPSGSGNGFALHFGIPLNHIESVKTINKLNKTTIDTATVNDVPFIAFTGIGFDAHVAHLFSKTKKRGLWKYISICTQSFFNYEEKEYSLTIDDEQYTTKAFIIVFANINQFGNNAKIAPKADATDGYFEISIIRKPNLLSGIKFAYDLFNGKLNTNKHVVTKKGKHVVVHNNIDNINLDGETVTVNNSLDLKVKPLSLTIIK